MTRSWTDEDTERLRALHADGATCNGAAREMGWSGKTISLHAKELGLYWDRASTSRATEAREDNFRRRMEALRERLLGDAERLRAEVWRPTTVYSFGGRENTYSEQTLPQPTPRDQQALTQAVQNTLASIERIDNRLTDQRQPEAVGMPGLIAQAIKAAAADQMLLIEG